MRCLILALLLPCAQEDPLPRLIERLGHADPAVRDQASLELRKKGAEIVPALEAAWDDSDCEVRLRVREILPALLERRALRESISSGLDWLIRHQSKAGSWSSKGSRCRCPADDRPSDLHEAGLTGLALLAVVRSPRTDPRSEAAITRAAAWLSDGRVGFESDCKRMYDIAIATLALSELCARSPSVELKKSVRQAVDHLLEARNPRKAWRYVPRSGDNDTSVTFWCGSALLAARRAGIEIPEPAVQGTLAWLDEVTERSGYSLVGYTYRGTAKITTPSRNEQFDRHMTTTAQGHVLRKLLGAPDGDRGLRMACEILLHDLPDADPNKRDFCYWFAGTLALRELQGPQGPRWERWSKAARPVLLGLQKPSCDGCAGGSWNPDDRWSDEAGRVYATAMNLLTLELLAPPE